MENMGCINSSVIAKKLCSKNNDIVGRCYKSTTEAFHCTSNFHNSRNFTALFIYFHKKNRLHKLIHYSFIHLLYSLMKLVFSFSREDAHYLSHILAFEPLKSMVYIVSISYLVIKKNLILWYVSLERRGKNMISL